MWSKGVRVICNVIVVIVFVMYICRFFFGVVSGERFLLLELLDVSVYNVRNFYLDVSCVVMLFLVLIYFVYFFRLFFYRFCV